jgi:hypothetical protein
MSLKHLTSKPLDPLESKILILTLLDFIKTTYSPDERLPPKLHTL